MPTANLLGVQFDMHLLGRLSISVATVLLISWAYRFYSSRTTAARKAQLRTPAAPDRPAQETSPNGTCQKCKMELRPQRTPKRDTRDADKQPPGPSQISSDRDDLTPDNTGARIDEGQTAQTGGAPPLTDTEETAAPQDETSTEEYNILEGDAPVLVEETEISKTNDDSVFGSTLKPSSPSDGGPASPTGRRSPCFLQRLEGGVGVGVGRELRQDLGLQGGYSSFLSKAEITVEDANLVLEGPGDQSVVRGKIYDYYVESSSHSMTDTSPVQHEGSTPDSQFAECVSRDSSLSESPSSLSPIIIRDLVLPQSPVKVEDRFPPVSPEPRSPSRPVLLRKESYLIAAKHSELTVLTPTPRASTPMRPSQASCSGESSPAGPLSPTTASRGPNAWEEPSLETVAGAKFLHMAPENMGSSELESFAQKLDLGNCMEVLSLAKKHGQAHLQKAALRVMSDNYLQVLRDPGLYGFLMAGEREQIQRLRTRGRRFLVVADMDPQDWMRNPALAAPPETPRRTFSGLHYYDDYKDTWHPLCPIPQEVISKGCAMCTMDNYLFVALGCKGTEREMKPSKKVFCYNPVTSIWKEVSPMNEARPHCKLAALQGHVYAIGGECLSTVERYDPRNDRWSFVAPLPNDTFAVAHRVTASNGELFVSGGTLRYTLLRYNPKTNAWRKSLIVGSKERTTEMVAVRNFLYRFDVSPLLGVSVYRYHTVARLWYECCTKRLLHCPAFQCVAMDETIYCVSRQFTMRFLADEISPAFIAEDLSVLAAAKGVVFPFVLSLPDKKTFQTSV